MYFAVFIPLFQLLYILLIYFQEKDRERRRAVLFTLTLFIYIGLLYLPWVLYVGSASG